jgi:tRNA (adenine57-N1/adenine58-N1)-methyltransferase catalytic subunit
LIIHGVGFGDGDLALLIDPDGKRYLVRLAQGESLQHHLGAVRHAEVIGHPDGVVVSSTQGKPFVAVRPRLADYALEMSRKSGIVYPKDAAQLLMWADIGPGMRVLEAGIGSGALTLFLLRAVGPSGQVIGCDTRADFLELAYSNVRASTGEAPRNLVLRRCDVYQELIERDLDRIVLDLPEPWRVLPQVPGCLTAGGWVAAYSPSILQVSQFVDAVRETRQYAQIETHEVLVRAWHVRGAAVRPEHQMVGHTGFLSLARLLWDRLEPGTINSRA